MRGEVLASRALALACVGRLTEARELATEAQGTTRAIEARVLTRSVLAIVAAQERSSSLLNSVVDAVDAAFDSGATDLLVASYRASPELLDALLSLPEVRERAVYLLARAGDQDLASAIGRSESATYDKVRLLSNREREIYDFVCSGLSTRDIAAALYISESTVKAHVQHIFDKFGVRSRKALALNAALARSGQAAPSIGTDGPTVSG
jgi:DNA-binding CsgD family transcriptional regulator